MANESPSPPKEAPSQPREHPTPQILSRQGGVFWGLTFLIVGMVMLLVALDVIYIGPNFTAVLASLLVILGGIYLLVMKAVR